MNNIFELNTEYNLNYLVDICKQYNLKIEYLVYHSVRGFGLSMIQYNDIFYIFEYTCQNVLGQFYTCKIITKG